MQRDQPELLPASDWVSFQSTDQPALQLLLWALFAGNCVRVGESLKVRCCWPGTGVFWGGAVVGKWVCLSLTFSPVLWMLIPGWRRVLGAGHTLYFPWGSSVEPQIGSRGFKTFFGVGDAWKLPCFIRAFCRRISTSWCLSLLFGVVRALGKFRDCHT